MYNFCTLFDSNYLTRGIAMYQSLKEHCNDFHLYIFAFDEKAEQILKKLNFEKITVLSLRQFENDKLLSVKLNRSRAEYCWTCTSSTILYVIENYQVENCTYIDSDLYFYSSPVAIFNELKNNSVLITEHRYTPKYDRSSIAGKYCVQFITFKNDVNGMKVLRWWVNACIEWCYDRYEDGKFGDQKYLDDWTVKFEGVHVLQNLGGGLAPWNIQQFEISEIEDNNIILITKSTTVKFKAIFFHFHYVRFYNKNLVDLGWFSLSEPMLNTFYAPYVKKLDDAMMIIKKIDMEFKESLRPFSIQNANGLKNKLKILIKQIIRYNLFNKKTLLNKI